MQILVEHKKKYLDRRIVEIEELKHGLGIDDFDVAIQIGHKLKGNGKTFGYPTISLIGITLEEAALARDKVRLREAIEQLVAHVEKNLRELH